MNGIAIMVKTTQAPTTLGKGTGRECKEREINDVAGVVPRNWADIYLGQTLRGEMWQWWQEDREEPMKEEEEEPGRRRRRNGGREAFAECSGFPVWTVIANCQTKEKTKIEGAPGPVARRGVEGKVRDWQGGEAD